VPPRRLRAFHGYGRYDSFFTVRHVVALLHARTLLLHAKNNLATSS